MKQLYQKDPPSITYRGRKQSELPREKQSKWYAVRVKSRMEKVFVHELRRLKISYFLPMEMRADLPSRVILNGYVFLLGTPADLSAAYATHRIVSVYRTRQQKAFRRDLKKFAEFHNVGSFERYERLKPGYSVVRIIKPHSLAGTEAKVVSKQNGLVGLDLVVLGSVAVFRIDPKHLEVI